MADIARIARAALPFFAKGKVVSGFQRGSKDLGCPTANFSDEVVENLPEQLACGVYCGFANVDDGQLHRMVSLVTSRSVISYTMGSTIWDSRFFISG